MSFIEAKEVYYRYPQAEKDALCGVDLTVEKGEYVAVIGHNGSGKSTLARLLNGLLQPTKGEIFVDGISAADKKTLFELRKRVGVVFQNPDNQLVASIVEDDVAFGPENIGVPRKEIGERIDFALSAVGMQEYRKSMASRLSGGQKQRVAIAGVLAIRPEVLILDESTAMLDPRGRREVTDVVKKLNRENGMTVLAVTHYMDEVCEADRVLIDTARQATYRSYAPYSHFAVGAAARLADGTVVSGSNQENAASPSSLCAERTTLFYANAQYPDQAVDTLAIAARNERGEFLAQPISPCGGCRQVMIEVERRFNRPMRILLYGTQGVCEVKSATDLLPLSFDDSAMK